MIQREELEQILNFVSNRWSEVAKEKDSKVMENLPSDFWMNSVGGKTANNGFWITTLMFGFGYNSYKISAHLVTF